MEDIKINSHIDRKTFFNVSLLAYFRVRTVIMVVVVCPAPSPRQPKPGTGTRNAEQMKTGWLVTYRPPT